MGAGGDAGGHIGPSLRGGKRSGNNGGRCKNGPCHAGRDGARLLPGTGGACGGMRLGRGFRQPKSKTEFGTAGCGHPALQKHHR